ncbi:MAG TPA: aldo/keto reductase [Actinomycetota bacterium]|nr:aldo/keto reductase [Actinomycetota bacterium]
MRRAEFGSTGATISRIGIGGWQAGGTGPWGGGPRADDDAVIAAIRRAVEGGVSWVDTAASYGLGHSEEVVARAIAPRSVGDEVLVFTKCGHPWDPPDTIRTDLGSDSIRRECEGSLRRLGIERIDLYQFHHADPWTPIETSWAAMAKLVSEGKVRWAGVSNFDVDLLERCEAIRHVDCVQPELSLLRPEALDGVIPWCGAHGTGVIGYSPLGTGALARADGATHGQAEGDDVLRSRGATVHERLVAIGARVGLSSRELAVAWALSNADVTGVICGARTPEQVDGWIGAGDVELSPELVSEIDAVAKGRVAAPGEEE